MKTFFQYLMMTTALAAAILVGTASPVLEGESQKAQQAATEAFDQHVETLSHISTYEAGEAYLARYCPTVSMTVTSDDTRSIYDPNTQTIKISEYHVDTDIFGWVFIHELMHHYQWSAKYQHDVEGWNAGIEDGDHHLEVQADQMTYYVYGEEGHGHYTTEPATGDALIEVKDLVYRGSILGC